MSTLLRVDDLRTHLRTSGGTVKAVDGVSFDIQRGETFCLVGESGSGKSVSALSIIDLLPADITEHPSGSIRLSLQQGGEGIDLLSLSAERILNVRGARIAMIFQEPMTSLNPVFSVGDQIIEALQLARPQISYEQARERAIEALRAVQIVDPEARIDEYPHRLSGGQRQRVMIAMALACEPDLLIADEPTTALDVTVQAEILKLMKDLQQRSGMSILFITHDFGVVAQMADRLAVMREGRIVENGPLREVLHSPRHDYTRALLAALPENLAREHKPPAPIRSQQPALVCLRDLQVHFPVRKGLLRRTVGHVKAVDGVDLQIPRGQILALVGESGCGKTTLGRAILRLTEPTAGSVRFADTELTSLSRGELRRLRRKLQFIFQDPMSSLNPRLTIAGTLIEPMAVHGIGASREERIELAARMLEEVQLKREHLWRYPHEFSGGQRQRIGIARSLVLGPEFIVCDEVTSALDVSVQAEILQLLLKFRAERELTLLFITHDIGVVEYIADATAVMRGGRVVELGPTAQVCGAPEHEYTQKLIAAVPRVF